MSQNRVAIGRFDKAAVLVEDEVLKSLLDLHVFLENVWDLVHVFAHRVAFHYKLAAARISYDITVVCRNCLESRTSREKSLGSSFIACEVVGLNVQCRN